MPCPPPPGRTAVRWPTPVPPPPAFPTQAGRPWQTGSGQATTLLLPDAVLALDMAVHPTAGWPAVAAVVWSGTGDPERVMVSVYNPRAARWSIARQVDLGPARIGRYTRTVRVAISGAGRVTAVWGMSDPDFADNDPPLAVWASDSDDVGETWSAPTRVAVGCRRVNDAVSVGYLLRRLLRGDAPATITRIPLAAPADWAMGSRMWDLRGLAFTRPAGPGVSFTWTDADGSGGAYALTSLDGGTSWGALERIAAPFTAGGIFSVAPAYDPVADRLVAVWTCCAGGVLQAPPATHSAQAANSRHI